MKFLLHVASGEREQSKTWGFNNWASSKKYKRGKLDARGLEIDSFRRISGIRKPDADQYSSFERYCRYTIYRSFPILLITRVCTKITDFRYFVLTLRSLVRILHNANLFSWHTVVALNIALNIAWSRELGLKLVFPILWEGLTVKLFH